MGDRSGVVSFERVTVTHLVIKEGRGVTGDPIREVAYFYSDEGEIIARFDPYEAVEARRNA